jgi:protein-S-isoprenylcysteine O-methyltransferase Ste14
MREAGTNIQPNLPSTTVVSSGPYSLTRNPIYLAMTLLYSGIAILVNTVWPLFLLPLVLVVIRFGVIEREEGYLERKFGKSYRDYKERVRRWI